MKCFVNEHPVIILIIITMFKQVNLFSTRNAVINEGPVSKTALVYNEMNFKNKINKVIM